MKPLPSKSLPFAGYLLVRRADNKALTDQFGSLDCYLTRAAARGVAAQFDCKVVRVTVGEATLAQSHPHNPERVPLSKVGTKEGWRLLDRDEIKSRKELSPHISLWGGPNLRHAWMAGPSRGQDTDWTYRTRLSRAELAKLP